MEKRVRLFFALPLPDAVLDGIITYEEQAEPGQEVRWVPRENLHITLLFVGWTDGDDIESVSRVAQDVLDGTEPARVDLTHVDWGPPKGNVRMVWAYGAGEKSWHTAKHELRKKLIEAELYEDTDEHPFLAHVTIARLKPVPRRSLPNIHEDFLHTFTPNEVLLMESKLARPHPTYRVLERYVLGHGS